MFPTEKIKRKIITKKESITDPNLGCNPDDRSTEEILKYGIIIVDKPPGPTSHQTVDYLKKILNIKKAGHSGTLDPIVTGVLPAALGRATKSLQALLPAGKEYIALMHLHKDIDKEIIKKTLNKFIGKIKQLPPIKSSVKRVERTRNIYYLDILEIKGQDILFKVGCQAGTYIRKLCHDIGRELKVGAHMQELRRTKAGPFDESDSFTLHDIADAYHYFKEGNDKFLRKIIQPVEKSTTNLPKIWVMDNAIESLCHGIDIKVPGIVKFHSGIQKDDLVAVMSLKDEIVALGNAVLSSEEIEEKEKGSAVKIHKVFMEPGTY